MRNKVNIKKKMQVPIGNYILMYNYTTSCEISSCGLRDIWDLRKVYYTYIIKIYEENKSQ